MAITTKKVVQEINCVRQNTPVKFQNFGMFFLKLMLQSVEDQEFIVDSLKNAATHADPNDCITIIEVVRPSVNLKDNETQYRFMVEHEFKCKFCDEVCIETVNLYGGQFRNICESCMDRAQDQMMDQSDTPPDYD